MSFSAQQQFPLNSVGPKGQHAFVGVHNVYFAGSTGLAATGYGIPGLQWSPSGATPSSPPNPHRIGTGTYALRFPPTREVDIFPSVSAPSGVAYRANVYNVNAYSGTANLQIFAAGGTGLTGVGNVVNPVPGTNLKLMFFVAPVTPF